MVLKLGDAHSLSGSIIGYVLISNFSNNNNTLPLCCNQCICWLVYVYTKKSTVVFGSFVVWSLGVAVDQQVALGSYEGTSLLHGLSITIVTPFHSEHQWRKHI